MAAGLLDPINIAAGLVPVVGEARVASILGRGAIEAMGAAERAGIRAIAGGVSGGAAMAGLQPLEYALSRSELEDYTMAQALHSIALGTVLGGGLHVVGGAVADRVTDRYANPVTQRIEDAGPEARATMLQGAVAQHLDGRPVDVAPVLDLAEATRAEPVARPAETPRVAEPQPPAPPLNESEVRLVVDERLRQAREEKTPASARESPPAGFIMGNVPDYVHDLVQRNMSTAERLGVIPDIERLAAEGKTATEVVAALGERLAPVRAIAKANGESERIGALDFVRSIRAGRGIPSQDQATEFVQWLNEYRARNNSSAAQAIDTMAQPPAAPVSDTARAATEAARAPSEPLAAVEQQIADMEARLAPPEMPAAEPSAARQPTAAEPETPAPAAPVKPAEVIAADAEIETAHARAAAYERAATCIIRGG
jgi:hypothetical protein